MIKRFLSGSMVFCLIIGFCAFCVSADNQPEISVESAVVYAGEEVLLSVKLENNPGIAALKLSLSYDSQLELLAVEDSGNLGSPMFSNSCSAKPYILSWNISSVADRDFMHNGVIATLRFRVKNSASAGEYNISLSCKVGEVFNSKMESFTPLFTTGAITVKQSDADCIHKNCVWKVTKEGNCSEDGEKRYVCSDCGFTLKTDSISKTEHKLTKKVFKATCISEGYSVYTCKHCDYSYKSDYVQKTNHKVNRWQTVKKTTSKKEGIEKGVCEVCKKEVNRSIPKLNADSSVVSSESEISSIQQTVSSQNALSSVTVDESEITFSESDTVSNGKNEKDVDISTVTLCVVLGLLVLSVIGFAVLKIIKSKK